MRIGNQILYQIIWYRIYRKTYISFIIIINNIITSKISSNIWFILFIHLLIFTVSVSFIISVEYLCHITSYQVYHIVMFPYCFYLLFLFTNYLFCILLKWDIMIMERCTINYQCCQALLRTPTNFRARHHPHVIVICISINRSLSLCFRQ